MAHSDTRTIFYGSVSGMAAKLVEYPFDTVKVRLQAQPADRPWYRGPMHCFTSTLQHEGLRGFYRGVASPLLGAMVENSVLFYTYGWFQGLLGDILGGPRLSAGSTSGLLTKRDATVTMEERLPMSQLVIAGALAGVCAGFVLTPIELVKCRIQIRHAGLVPQATATAATTTAAVAGSTVRGSHNGGGTLSTTLRIIKYEGIGALFQGFTPTMIREAGGGIAWFGTYELVTRYFLHRQRDQLLRQIAPSSPLEGVGKVPRGDNGAPPPRVLGHKDLRLWELIIAGACAGIAYNGALYPVDVIKSQIQTSGELTPAVRPPPVQPSSSAAASSIASRPSPSSWRVTTDLYRAGGLRVFYRGCGITLLRAAPSNAVLFVTYEYLSRAVEAMFLSSS